MIKDYHKKFGLFPFFYKIKLNYLFRKNYNQEIYYNNEFHNFSLNNSYIRFLICKQLKIYIILGLLIDISRKSIIC